MDNRLHSSYEKIQAELVRACISAARMPQSVRLIAVSKGQESPLIQDLMALGHRRFGENRLQEAQRKYGPLKALTPEIELHLIGPLQRNKVRAALGLFSVIHSLDRISLAEAIAHERDHSGWAGRLLIQVNTGREPQKAGVWPEHYEQLLGRSRELGLPVVGLMCVPPLGDDPSSHFANLAAMACQSGLAELSMGMSADFAAAIMAGATYIRVGSALFGTRSAGNMPPDEPDKEV